MELEKRTEIRPYEAVIIVHPDTSEDDQKALFKRNQGIIKNFKAPSATSIRGESVLWPTPSITTNAPTSSTRRSKPLPLRLRN